MANQRVAGVAYLKVTHATGTQQIAVRGKLKVAPTPTEKEGLAGQDGVHGYKEMPKVPFMELDITNGRDFDPRVLDSATDITATAELANGQVWVGVEGWRAGVSEIDAEEGSIQLKLEFTRITLLSTASAGA